MRVRKVGTKEWYSVLDGDCPARSCAALGVWHVRGATSSGSRSTGDRRHACLTREARGCPQRLPKPEWAPGEKARWRRKW